MTRPRPVDELTHARRAFFERGQAKEHHGRAQERVIVARRISKDEAAWSEHTKRLADIGCAVRDQPERRDRIPVALRLDEIAVPVPPPGAVVHLDDYPRVTASDNQHPVALLRCGQAPDRSAGHHELLAQRRGDLFEGRAGSVLERRALESRH